LEEEEEEDELSRAEQLYSKLHFHDQQASEATTTTEEAT
jgi:hypothetical protein